MAHYDVVVIGAGIVGSSTAYNLAKAGQKTLLLEQFPLLHHRGSSHGHSRSLSRKYPLPQADYSRMVEEAVPMWRTLERESGKEIFKQIGQLSMYMNLNEMKTVEDSNRKLGVQYRKLSNQELQAEFPQFRMPNHTEAILEKQSGMIRADKALQAFQEMFRRFGGEIRDNEAVVRLIPGPIVLVETIKGSYMANKIVIAVGSWSAPFLKPLSLNIPIPITPWRVSVFYWRIKHPGSFSPDTGMPMFRFPSGTDNTAVYSVPEVEYPGLVKVCLHKGFPIKPDSRDSLEEDGDLKLMCKFVRDHLPGVDGSKPEIIERCIYSMTPDEGFLLDKHPSYKNIVFGAGFSGHGFKMAPVTGHILSCLALDKDPGYDMRKFQLKNYEGGFKSKM